MPVIKETAPDYSKEIPRGWKCTAKGVEMGIEKNNDGVVYTEWVPVTYKPIYISALSRDIDGENHGLLVVWYDVDNRKHERAIPRGMFHKKGTELVEYLSNGGLPIDKDNERYLISYLSRFNVKNRLVAATMCGWHGESFVMPSEVVNEPDGEKLVYQPSGFSDAAKAIHKHGDFSSWYDGVKDLSPIPMFAVMAALSAPVRYRINVAGGGFHFFDSSSKGKTTMLQAAASVWGNGADPAISSGKHAYIQRWNSTANALEAKAEVFNDLLMAVDEIGEGSAREFGQTIYRLISGTGRGRSGRDGSLRESKHWRCFILSAGELAVSDFIESGGSSIKGGMLVRMPDIDLSAAPALFASAEESNRYKKLFSEHFGHAGVEFLKSVRDLSDRWSEFDFSQIGNATCELTGRALERFALVAHTGLLAVRAGVLPWTEQQVIDSSRLAFDCWRSGSNIISDVERGVSHVLDFILEHESRFESNPDKPPVIRAGWYRDGMYHFTTKAFKEACKGSDPTKVKMALKDSGLLHFSHGLNGRIRVEGKKVLVVSVKSEIFQTLSNSDVTDVDGVDKPDKKMAEAGHNKVVVNVDSVATNAAGHTGHKGKSAMCPHETLIDKGLDTPVTLVTPEKGDLQQKSEILQIESNSEVF